MTLTETLSVTLRETLGERAVRGEEQSEKGRQLRGEGEKRIGMIEGDGRMQKGGNKGRFFASRSPCLDMTGRGPVRQGA